MAGEAGQALKQSTAVEEAETQIQVAKGSLARVVAAALVHPTAD